MKTYLEEGVVNIAGDANVTMQLVSLSTFKIKHPETWHIWDTILPEETHYVYIASDDDNDCDRYYEDGRIYNPDGSLAENKLVSRNMYFYAYPHAPLNILLNQTIEPIKPSNFMYGLPAGNYENLKRIAEVRDRLHIPDWLALLVVANLVEETSLEILLSEVPDIFDTCSADWANHFLGIKPNDINMFGDFHENGLRYSNTNTSNMYGFDTFWEIVELEKQDASN